MRNWFLFALIPIFVLCSFSVMGITEHLTGYGGNWTNLALAEDNNYATGAEGIYQTAGVKQLLYVNKSWNYDVEDVYWNFYYYQRTGTGGIDENTFAYCYNFTANDWMVLWQHGVTSGFFNLSLAVPENCNNGSLSMFKIKPNNPVTAGQKNIYYEGAIRFNDITEILQHSYMTIPPFDRENSIHQFNGKNYSSRLFYNINYSCYGDPVQFTLYDNAVPSVIYNISCVSNVAATSSTYIGDYGEEHNISFNNLLNVTVTFIPDQAPNIIYSQSYLTGFSTGSLNVTLSCNDSYSSHLNYSSTANGISLIKVLSTTNRTFVNASSLNNGQNNFVGVCCNALQCNRSNITVNLYQTELALIDEKTRLDFNVSNTSSCKVYIDNETIMYDLKVAGTNKVNFTGGASDSLRFELVYTDGTIITRYIHPDLLPNDTQIRVCANKDDQIHKEQLIASASRKPSVMKSVWADCVVGADYTRFAYETYKVMRDYTIDTQYYLFTWDEDGNQVMLAAIDGGVTSTINLDVLEFQNEGYNLNILADSLAFDQTGNTTMRIYYQNLDNDNTAISLTITNMDTSTIMLSQSAFPDMNEFTVYFDWSTYTNITNTTLFKVELIRTSATGTETIKKYFNTRGSIGRVGSGLAVGLALILMIFGLTFAATRITMSWFGIAICLASIVLLSQAVAAWYVTFMMMIDVIVLVYFAIMLIVQNYGTTAGIN